MSKIRDIISGWGAYLSSNVETLKIAKKRAEICVRCPKVKEGYLEILMPDFAIKEVKGLKCGICNCPLSTITRSRAYKCKLSKW